jgi:anaerobic magnesium-protoporphyrin IX monomethyl ester cyclase
MPNHILGADPHHPLDAVFVNSPLKDYDREPRRNDFTLPVLGLGYIATYARKQGYNVGVLDIESLGIGLSSAATIINEVTPRWVGLNLLAPTYKHSVTLLRRLDPEILIMLGGHQAKAMPRQILSDPRIPRIDALVLGEADTRATALLGDIAAREHLPGVLWPGGTGKPVPAERPATGSWLAPDIDQLPVVDRSYFDADPFRAGDGRLEANMVGSRGCYYDCSFCGAAISANQDILVRTRDPENILAEMNTLRDRHGVSAIRFVDDLFLAKPQFMTTCLHRFAAERVAERFVWDATGRINVLHRAEDQMLDLMVQSGCREVALGIESGDADMLKRIDKRITPEMTVDVVRRLTAHGIAVKGYFILGFPTETAAQMHATERHVRDLWATADRTGGSFRASVFEFRPYPGTPEWQRLMATGRYTADQLLAYEHVDLTADGADEAMRERDEFNFSVNQQFGEAPVPEIRAALARLTREQDERKRQIASAA